MPCRVVKKNQDSFLRRHHSQGFRRGKAQTLPIPKENERGGKGEKEVGREGRWWGEREREGEIEKYILGFSRNRVIE